MLSCEDNQISALDVTKCPELAMLTCSHNQLSSLNLRRNREIYMLDCSFNNIEELDVSNCVVRLAISASYLSYDNNGVQFYSTLTSPPMLLACDSETHLTY